jgi:hypothetical protein
MLKLEPHHHSQNIAVHIVVLLFSSPEEKDKSYESLYPVDSSVVKQPDFHQLSFYKPIDLSQIGFEEQREFSKIWKHALEKGDKTFR